MPSFDSSQKRIWFYWHQGLDSAPNLVRQCHRSWRIKNPNWEVMTLSYSNLYHYVEEDNVNTLTKSPQAFSDLVRINLISRHGGVWVDASCFCIKPLDNWIAQYMEGGFFAFSNPGPNRLLSSWFLASEKESYIASRWADAANTYWSGPAAPTRLVRPRLAGWATALHHDVWFTRSVKEWLGLYPYYWFHYLFRYLYERDERFRAAWNVVPQFAADVPHTALRKKLGAPIDVSFRREIDQMISPLYKLNWRFDDQSVSHGSVLHYLYETL